ncbi:hypothetical protein WG66_004550 [Moniliophthora roreri]|nr:hypothetical protein WG66_004550 [Moniliophthora roreri]
MSTLEQNSVSPAPATQIPLPPSAQSVREGEPMSHPGTAPQPTHATEKTEEKRKPTVQQSWEKLMAEVEKYDEGMVRDGHYIGNNQTTNPT